MLTTKKLVCEESGWDFRPLFLLFPRTLNVHAIQEAGDMMCCWVHVNSHSLIVQGKEDSDLIVKE